MAGLGDLEKAISELDAMALTINPLHAANTPQTRAWCAHIHTTATHTHNSDTATHTHTHTTRYIISPVARDAISVEQWTRDNIKSKEVRMRVFVCNGCLGCV